MRRKQIVIKKLEELDYLFKNLKYAYNTLRPDQVTEYYRMIQEVMDELYTHVESEDEK